MTRICKTLAATALACLLLACGDSISQQNFQKLKSGMTPAEVEAILGKPTDTSAAAGTYKDLTGSVQNSVWKSSDGKRVISIMFVNGKSTLITSSGL